MRRVLSNSEAARLLARGRSYRSTVVVHARPVADDAEWTTSRGDVLQAKVGDWWVTDGVSCRSVAGDVFRATYECVGGDRYRKTAPVTAVVVSEPFQVRTREGAATGAAGDWLVRNPSGECWPVTATKFDKCYEPIESDETGGS